MNILNLISLLGGSALPQGLLASGNFDSASSDSFLAALALAQPDLGQADRAQQGQQTVANQRAFSASTPIITTADEMLDELNRVKR